MLWRRKSMKRALRQTSTWKTQWLSSKASNWTKLFRNNLRAYLIIKLLIMIPLLTITYQRLLILLTMLKTWTIWYPGSKGIELKCREQRKTARFLEVQGTRLIIIPLAKLPHIKLEVNITHKRAWQTFLWKLLRVWEWSQLSHQAPNRLMQVEVALLTSLPLSKEMR